MKSVLISIRPWPCNQIADLKKTLEVRKNKPRLEPPFKCYIYMTAGGWAWRDPFATAIIPKKGEMYNGSQSVIGEFVCDGISHIAYTMDGLADSVDCEQSCLTPMDFIEYGKGKPLYGWHISNLKIFDVPKSLLEFGMKRAPQSWCYVNEVA